MLFYTQIRRETFAMQLLLALPCVAIYWSSAQASVVAQNSNVSIDRPSTELVEIYIQIAVDESLGLSTSNDSHSTITHGPQPLESYSSCNMRTHTSVYNETSRFPTLASLGRFINSTSSPSATGSFQTPSQVELAPFFSDSAAGPQSEMLSLGLATGLLFVTLII